MTLCTTALIETPVPAELLFQHLLAILEDDPEFTGRATWEFHRAGDAYEHIPGWTYEADEFQSTIGQGLAAILQVRFGEKLEFGDAGPHCIQVSFDTAYGYRRGDAGCSDLHAFLLSEVGRFLERFDASWVWEHEYSGKLYGPNDIANLGCVSLGDFR